MSNLGKDALTCIIQNLAELDALTDMIIVDRSGISDSVLEFLVASGGAAGDDTGAYFHHGFLFSVRRHCTDIRDSRRISRR